MEGRRSALRRPPAGIHHLEDRQDAEVVYIGAVVAFHEQGGLRHDRTAGAPDQLAHGLQRLPRADDVIHQPHPFALHLHRVTAVNVEFLFHLRGDRLVPHYHRGEHERADLFAAYDVGFEPEVRGDGMRQRDALRLGGHEEVAVLHLRRQLRSEEHTSELQSRLHLVCRLLLEKKKKYKRLFHALTTLHH